MKKQILLMTGILLLLVVPSAKARIVIIHPAQARIISPAAVSSTERSLAIKARAAVDARLIVPAADTSDDAGLRKPTTRSDGIVEPTRSARSDALVKEVDAIIKAAQASAEVRISRGEIARAEMDASGDPGKIQQALTGRVKAPAPAKAIQAPPSAKAEGNSAPSHVINTNTSSILTERKLAPTRMSRDVQMERLSSGYRTAPSDPISMSRRLHREESFQERVAEELMKRKLYAPETVPAATANQNEVLKKVEQEMQQLLQQTQQTEQQRKVMQLLKGPEEQSLMDRVEAANLMKKKLFAPETVPTATANQNEALTKLQQAVQQLQQQTVQQTVQQRVQQTILIQQLIQQVVLQQALQQAARLAAQQAIAAIPPPPQVLIPNHE